MAAAAAKYGTMFGVSSLGTVSLEEMRRRTTTQVYQFYFHKDRGLNRAMMDRAKEAGVDVMMLTVDSITGGEPGTRQAQRLFNSGSGCRSGLFSSSRPSRGGASAI